MRKFKDNKGRTWNVDLNGHTNLKVHRDCDIWLTDLADITDGEKSLAAKLFSPPYVLLIEVLCSMCESQMDEKSVSGEEFAAALGGDSLGDASEALAATVGDFFTSRDQREAYSSLMRSLWETQATLEREATKAIKTITSGLAAKRPTARSSKRAAS